MTEELHAMFNEAWDHHIAYMHERFGRRDPDCFWCGQPVVMSLQTLHGGGGWTTELADEGPCSSYTRPEAEHCTNSPDSRHDVVPNIP